MKATDKSALLTPDLLPDTVQKRRGRPPKAITLSSKERQAKYRKSRVLLDVGGRMAATVASLAKDFDKTESEVTAELIRFALCNKNWRQTGF